MDQRTERHTVKLLLFLCLVSSVFPASARRELENRYSVICARPFGYTDYFPLLRRFATSCSSVIEVGLKTTDATCCLLLGLAEGSETPRSYLGIGRKRPHERNLQFAQRLADGNHISFLFWEKDSLGLDLPAADLLYLDSLHTYCHLTYELETFAPSIAKYIVINASSSRWLYDDDTSYFGNYFEYPAFIQRYKRGIYPAVLDFLARHAEWQVIETPFNCPPWTLLKRVYL